MELSDPRVTSRVQGTLQYLAPIRVAMSGPAPFTYNHITINSANVLTIFLGCLGVGWLFAYASQKIGPRHPTWKGMVEVGGWGSLLLVPAMLFWVSGSPSLIYGTPLWNYLGLIWYGGYYLMGFVFLEQFGFHGRHFKGSVTRLPRNWKSWAKPKAPPYIQIWFART